MRFSAQHRFAAPPEAVVALLVDPDFVTGVALPDLSTPTVVAHDDDGTHCCFQLRYEYVGQLDPIAKRVVGAQRLTWLQELRIDRRTQEGTLTFAAEAAPDKLRGLADMTITAAGGGSVRTISGELNVRIPLVGGTAERRILPGVVRRLDVEAEAIAARLAADEERR